MRYLLFILFYTFVGVSFSQTTGTFTDARDGKVYKTVVIGTQTWMAENLNVSTFRNGDPIPEVKNVEEWTKAGEEGKPAWCYYDNDPKNGDKFGKLYNWFAVNDPRGLAPVEWHIPSDKEWNKLKSSLGGKRKAGEKMKIEGESANNSSGFTGLLAGSCTLGKFLWKGGYGFWWSSNEVKENEATLLFLQLSESKLGKEQDNKNNGCSVRCIKD